MGEVGSRVLDRVLKQKKSRTRLIYGGRVLKNHENTPFFVFWNTRVS